MSEPTKPAEPEIYRDPTRDVAMISLGPYVTMSLPMIFFSKYGPVHADWEELHEKLNELYALLTLGHPPKGGVTLAEVLGVAKEE